MATRTIRVDDLDGTEATGDVQVEKFDYAFPNAEGMLTMFTVDLTRANAEKFVKAMAKYVAVSTVVTLPSEQKRKRNDSGDSEAIRAWARAQTPPIEVSDRGRIPAELRAQFEAAQLTTQHPDDPKPENNDTPDQ